MTPFQVLTLILSFEGVFFKVSKAVLGRWTGELQQGQALITNSSLHLHS